MDKVTAAMVLTSLSTSPLVRSPPVRPNGKPSEPGAAGRGSCSQELCPWWRANGECLSSAMLGIIPSLAPTWSKSGAALAEMKRNIFFNYRAALVYEMGDAHSINGI